MKRANILLLMTVAAVGLLLLAVSTMIDLGSSRAAPLAQTDEGEPNDTIGDPTLLSVPDTAMGSAENQPITATDFFRIPTTIGSSYRATLNIGGDGKLFLRMHFYNAGQQYVTSSSSSSSSTELSWTAAYTTYYIEVKPSGPATSTLLVASYVLDLYQVANTPTPPPPTASPIPTSPSVTGADAYEDNDNDGQAYTLPVATSVSLSSLKGVANFYPDKEHDHDWFKLWAKDDKWYKVTTSALSGVDTNLEIFDRHVDKKHSDDDGGGGYASSVSWKAKYDGWYYIRVTNLVATDGTYNMTVEESSQPPTTPAPTAASPSGDSCENNPDFDHACIIAADKAYTFNLIPPYPSGSDNDYFKLWIKANYLYDCYTSNLDPGVDPNMIVFWGPSEGSLIAGNDDRTDKPGDVNSRVTYYSTYEGWMYVLVGTGDRTPPDINNSKYTLECKREVPGQPTATATPQPAATQSPQQTSAPPTPTPSDELSIRPLVTPAPAPVGTPATRFIPVSLLVYYDGNNDGQPGAGEGISGVSVQAYEAATNQLLAQGFTDEQGKLDLTLAAQGPARVSVPFFGFSQLVAGEGGNIYLRIPPQSFPGNTP